MIRFTIGIALLCFTAIIGSYVYFDKVDMLEIKQSGLRDVQSRRDQGKQLQTRIKTIRKTSMVQGDDQKFTIERLLDIGAPGMELRFVGQPRTLGGNKALYRHTFRINGPATFMETQKLVEKLSKLPGFTTYKYCYGCTKVRKGTPENMKMIQIEGYLYVYDPNTLY